MPAQRRLSAKRLRDPEMLAKCGQLRAGERGSLAVAMPCLRLKLRNVLLVIVDHVAADLAVEGAAVKPLELRIFGASFGHH